jgi:hypothetical protein
MAINHAVQCGELKLLRKASTKRLFGICFKVNYIYKTSFWLRLLGFESLSFQDPAQFIAEPLRTIKKEFASSMFGEQ